MYKLCKTEKASARQREIEIGLLDMLCRKRFDDITVSELCDGIGVPRKAFYRYFDSKEGALRALIDHTLTGFGGTPPEYSAGKRRSLTRDIEGFFLFWLENRTLLDALDRSLLFSYLIDAALDFPIRDMVSLEKFLPDDSAEMRRNIFKFAICGLMFTMLSWYKTGFAASPREMARTACRMLSRPLFPNLDKIGIPD